MDSIPISPANSIVFIDGAASDRTFESYEQVSATQVRVRDCQTCNAQYLSTAAQQCSRFLVSEQLPPEIAWIR